MTTTEKAVYLIAAEEENKYMMKVWTQKNEKPAIIKVSEDDTNKMQHLVCAICLEYARKPVECVHCDTLTCKLCFLRWKLEGQGNSSNCVVCKNDSPNRTRKFLNRHAQNAIELTFTCAACKATETTSYAELQEHENKCFKMKCPQLCNNDMYSLESLFSHYKSCPETIINCGNCNNTMASKEKNSIEHAKKCHWNALTELKNRDKLIETLGGSSNKREQKEDRKLNERYVNMLRTVNEESRQ